MDWSEVRLVDRLVEATAQKAKTASRRLVPVLDNLAAWLTPYANLTGLVWPHSEAYVHECQADVATDAKVKWKSNALRHSFISCRVAAIQNTAQVALEAGNSPQMIFQHYQELVRPVDAARWFGVSPEASSLSDLEIGCFW